MTRSSLLAAALMTLIAVPAWAEHEPGHTRPGQGTEEGHPGGGGRGEGRPHRPPPEALDACQGKAAGAGCSFQGKHGNVEGTCFTPASDKPLACRPSKPPPEAPPQK